MTQVNKYKISPRQASKKKTALDKLLDPSLFKALSDPTRLLLLSCLLKCNRSCSVSEIAECCSVDFSVVARHLSLLARCELLEATKQGRTVWYTVRSGELATTLRNLAEAIEQCGGSCCQDKKECCI